MIGGSGGFLLYASLFCVALRYIHMGLTEVGITVGGFRMAMPGMTSLLLCEDKITSRCVGLGLHGCTRTGSGCISCECVSDADQPGKRVIGYSFGLHSSPSPLFSLLAEEAQLLPLLPTPRGCLGLKRFVS